ncbi:response regulator transcription factor [Anaerotalea alkaliphila]|uniref:Stage 0 sporulation protein A homolog n=1 Tax=Anaerotalea alkaliphila TaxID=2662126 RepID=A0A7X5HWU7_9FIRM|nr:response regulator transcription factor [Anaerotalea alkaliphila]NDL68063.1 response regulator transcription factor [Anaerotalea alkaliphila]
MKGNILIAEDEERLRKLIVKYLQGEGYHVLEARDGREALELFQENSVDLLVLDVMMPGMDGFQVCREVRGTSPVPILMLTARTEEEDALQGFKLGADDYVAKPFRTRELMARIKALLVRSGKLSAKEEIQVGAMRIQLAARRVEVQGEEIYLSPKEYDTLLYLVENRGRALSREQILNKVWGYDYYGDDRSVDTIIKRLRKKMGTMGDWIYTVRGMGYRFEEGEE